MAAVTHRLPGELKLLFVGRILYKEVDGKRVRGETHSYKNFFQDGPNSINKSYWVQWEDGKRVVLSLTDVQQCATEEFVASSWMPPGIIEWQKAGWDLERVDKEHVGCVLAFQEAISGDAPEAAMASASVTAGLSSRACNNPLQPPCEMEQAAEAAEAEMDIEEEQMGTSGLGRGDMSGDARIMGEEPCHGPRFQDFESHGFGDFWRRKAREALAASTAAVAAGGAPATGDKGLPDWAEQAQPAEGPEAGDTSVALGGSARSGAATLPHAAVLPGQGHANIVWRARRALAIAPPGDPGEHAAREAPHHRPDAEQPGSPRAAAAHRTEGAGAGRAAGRAPVLSEAIPEWPSESAGGASAPYTQRTFSRRCKYPDKHCMALGDIPAKEWVAKEKAGEFPGGEYVVTEILDERWSAADERREFIVKWKGFELHPSQWIAFDDLDDCAALDAWERRHAPACPPKTRARKRAAEAPPSPLATRKGTRRRA